ncbi:MULTISPECIES: hypothetical protein [Brucella/Ochrobactrum group]|uniref:hypothetical protein n=1 Tax=Brucella/Ochrobactrum group TaxID=2826938 RepID=UPI001C05E210|nr:hypothetical protein [Brucella sp. NBRC 12950]QWK80367.1 hypothetical protein KMS41_21670 [Ochrobactrum sp. BTU1]GLU29526.1 hypothetical protein Brsp01_47590 [Brucella sp. NBRC 12950]
MFNVRKWSFQVAFFLGLACLPLSQATATSSNSADLSANERTELQRSAGIVCEGEGKDACTAGNIESGDYYNVTIYGNCAVAAYFGRIGDEAASLRKDVAVTGTDGKTEGVLASKQLVCIKAAAQVNATDKEYYVVALPMDHGAECKGEELCKEPKALSGDFKKTMAGCKRDSHNGYRGCPEGWVFASEMEAYSNGLPQQ